jgi:hypothetical protein
VVSGHGGVEYGKIVIRPGQRCWIASIQRGSAITGARLPRLRLRPTCPLLLLEGLKGRQLHGCLDVRKRAVARLQALARSVSAVRDEPVTLPAPGSCSRNCRNQRALRLWQWQVRSRGRGNGSGRTVRPPAYDRECPALDARGPGRRDRSSRKGGVVRWSLRAVALHGSGLCSMPRSRRQPQPMDCARLPPVASPMLTRCERPTSREACYGRL